MKIKAILIDHDGTLVDSEMAHYVMWRDILYQYSIDLSHEEYTNQYSGIPTATNARLIVENYSLTVSPGELFLAKSKATSLYLSKTPFPLMKGAYEFIVFFHGLGLKIGIVTGAGSEGLNTTIIKHGFEKYLSTTVSGDDVAKSKPAPDCYTLAAKRIGLHPSECLAIEDTLNGIAAATTANIRCVGVSPSEKMRNRFENTAYVCSDLYEATDWIANNFQISLISINAIICPTVSSTD